MSSSVAEFAATLKQLDSVKAPGVSGSRIRRLVDFANRHVSQYEDVLRELKAYVATSPAANKLGAMYVIDAILRAYQEDAKKAGGSGDAAAAYEACQEAMPDLMRSLKIRSQAVEQFEKMRKLLDIWARADTLSEATLDEWAAEYFREPYSTTPPGSPPTNWAGLPANARPEPVIPKKEAPSADALFGILQNLAQSKPDAPAAKGGASNSPKHSAEGSTDAAKTNSMSAAAPTAPTGADLLQQMMQQAQRGTGAADSDPRMAALSGAKQERGRDLDRGARSASWERNRSRSPGREESPPQPRSRAGDATRNLKHDPELKPDRIRVFSRTLYVGSIPEGWTDAELRETLEKVSPLQSVVYNRDRRHAFVKMHSRQAAEQMRDTFERRSRDGRVGTMRVKWGVGFGPRENFDYYRGVSVIPLAQLTEADVRWASSAEYGGTGGKKLEAGMVLEEPDIELGHANLGSNNFQRQKMMQQQQQMMNPMMMGMPPMGMPPMGMPNGMPNGMQFPMMPGFPMMPPNGQAPNGMPDMSQMFAQMQQMQMQMMQAQEQPPK